MYETPECALLDKKSIKLENVQDFQWSPSAPVLSACQAEQSSGNLPARVVLLKIPERTELRQKNLFSVSGRSIDNQSLSLLKGHLLEAALHEGIGISSMGDAKRQSRQGCAMYLQRLLS